MDDAGQAQALMVGTGSPLKRRVGFARRFDSFLWEGHARSAVDPAARQLLGLEAAGQRSDGINDALSFCGEGCRGPEISTVVNIARDKSAELSASSLGRLGGNSVQGSAAMGLEAADATGNATGTLGERGAMPVVAANRGQAEVGTPAGHVGTTVFDKARQTAGVPRDTLACSRAGNSSCASDAVGDVLIGRLRWRAQQAEVVSSPPPCFIDVNIDRHQSPVGNPFLGAPRRAVVEAYDTLLHAILLFEDVCAFAGDVSDSFSGARPPRASAMECELLSRIAHHYGVRLHPVAAHFSSLLTIKWLWHHAHLLSTGRCLRLLCWCCDETCKRRAAPGVCHGQPLGGALRFLALYLGSRGAHEPQAAVSSTLVVGGNACPPLSLTLTFSRGLQGQLAPALLANPSWVGALANWHALHPGSGRCKGGVTLHESRSSPPIVQPWADYTAGSIPVRGEHTRRDWPRDDHPWHSHHLDGGGT